MNMADRKTNLIIMINTHKDNNDVESLRNCRKQSFSNDFEWLDDEFKIILLNLISNYITDILGYFEDEYDIIL